MNVKRILSRIPTRRTEPTKQRIEAKKKYAAAEKKLDRAELSLDNLENKPQKSNHLFEIAASVGSLVLTMPAGIALGLSLSLPVAGAFAVGAMVGLGTAFTVSEFLVSRSAKAREATMSEAKEARSSALQERHLARFDYYNELMDEIDDPRVKEGTSAYREMFRDPNSYYPSEYEATKHTKSLEELADARLAGGWQGTIAMLADSPLSFLETRDFIAGEKDPSPLVQDFTKLCEEKGNPYQAQMVLEVDNPSLKPPRRFL